MSTHTVDRCDWRAAAACRDVDDPELFFPAAEYGPAYDEQVAAAKLVCAGCPVRAACLAWALEALPHGVAGGLSEDERRQVARTGQAQPIGSGSPRSRNARATRSRAVAQVAAGRASAAVAAELGVSERTVKRWARGGAA